MSKIKRVKGITLIALVITIIILLILAGISISALSSNNGIFERAKESKEKSELGQAQEEINAIINEWTIEKATGTQTIKEFLDSKVTSGEINSVTDNGNGTYEIITNGGYITTIDENGNILEKIQKAGPHPKVSDIKVVANPDGSGDSLGNESTEEGTKLYIVFNHSIEGGTTTVDKELPYEITTNGDVEFTITGTIQSKSYEKKINVKINQYKKSLKIGTYVKYDVSYTDAYTDYEFTANDGWRILDGIRNKNGTYSNVKLISTGIPAKLIYYASGMTSSTWMGTPDDIKNYIEKFYQSSSSTNNNMRGAAGLFYNFEKIEFNQGNSASNNKGCYKKVNNTTSGAITGKEFLADGATEVHNLTMYELNQARNKTHTTTIFGLNEPDSGSKTSITAANDAATGLFFLRDLENYGYTSLSKTHSYWLASPYTGHVSWIWSIMSGGSFFTSNNSGCLYGIRPVVTLPDNVTLDIVGN